MSQIRRILAASCLVVMIIMLLLEVRSYSARKNISRLSELAVGPDSDKAQAALEELNRYSDSRVTEILLAVARGETTLRWEDTQKKAIELLSGRGDKEIPAELANLLQPHDSLVVRFAVANALRKTTCDVPCVAAILSYLSRIEYGEMNIEDLVRLDLPKDMLSRVNSSTQQEQHLLYENLYVVLRREWKSTLFVLGQVYGLGTENPSRFGLHLVSKSKLTDACGLIRRSQRILKEDPPESFVGPRDEVASTIEELKCKLE